MKRILFAIASAFMMITSVNAQRLTDIQAEARFITDKMVLELGLSNVQRNNLLNINLTYLDGIRSYRDIDAYGWKYRNKQLKRMLSERQWRRYKESYYFYRPIAWRNNVYVHNIYVKYPGHKRPGYYGHPGNPHKFYKRNGRYDKHDKKYYKHERKYDKHERKYDKYEREYDKYERKYDKHDKKYYKHDKKYDKKYDNRYKKHRIHQFDRD